MTRCESIQDDVKHVEYAARGPFSFVLLDVDLYKPTRKALGELYASMSSGGIIIVDDCDEHDLRWDGADQAYKEFMRSIGQPPRIEHQKLGVVHKP